MADVSAFRGFRYNLARAGTLGDLVAPPYDVINAEQQQNLYDRSPYNIIRLTLNPELPGDTETNNRYTRAAKFLRDWQNEEILTQDPARALYVYHQEFEVEGKRYNRRGFLARVRLEKFGEGKIYPHEQTMPGPKADRLKLFHATNMNLSPIFGLFPDEEGLVQDTLDKAVGQSLPLEAKDDLGVTSRLWPVEDQQTVSAVTGMMSPKPIFIADGHHRYETSVRYLEEKREAAEVTDSEAPANFVMMMLVGMSDPGLAILPTHRLVSGIDKLSSEKIQEILQPHFECETVGKGEEAAGKAWETIEIDGGQNLMAFGSISDNNWILARFKNPAIMAEIASGQSEAWRGLGVSILHELVLGKLLPEATNKTPTSKYVHLMNEVNEAMGSQSCDLAVLVPPASMKHVEDIAGNLEKMPPKSTYFYPKLLSGLVFYSLKTG